MYLKSVQGEVLYRGNFSSIKKGVEMAVEEKIDLSNIDLRHANLANAQIDGAKMNGACFWGANLNEANLAEGTFKQADFRTANCLGTCLAETDCTGADFSGSYFSRTICRDAVLTDTRFSCPSLFSLNLVEVKSLKGAIYSHWGEVDCDLSHAPLVIRGLEKPLIFMDDCLLLGQKHIKTPIKDDVLASILSSIQKTGIEEFKGLSA